MQISGVRNAVIVSNILFCKILLGNKNHVLEMIDRFCIGISANYVFTSNVFTIDPRLFIEDAYMAKWFLIV